jgi:hypothetical protein
MFNRKVIALITLSFCFFECIGNNMNNQTIDKKLGKPVSSFVRTSDFIATDTFYYTTELSRILLVGEPRVFETVRGIPLINVIMIAAPLFNNRLFDNRFKKFIKNGEKHSQSQLQEAIEDAVVLTTCNTNAYSVSKLLDYLSEALQSKIGYIKDQIKSDENLDKYEELLSYVQKLKEQLKTNGSITLTLRNGNTATVNNDMFNTVRFS